MSFEADFKAHLQAASAISDIVGERIHPGILPGNSPLSAITYTLLPGEPQVCMDGFTSGLTRYPVQIDCWSLTFERVIALALAVRDRMSVAAATFTPILINFPLLDDYEPETRRWRRSIEVACWFKE